MKSSAIVIDIDGVLCDNVQRQRDWIANYEAPVGAASTLWDGFYVGLPEDPPKNEWVVLTTFLSVTIVLLTCRPNFLRLATTAWLATHGVVYDELIMWDPDLHGYYEHKAVAIEDLKVRYDIQLVIEDSERHVETFRAAGVPVIHVLDGLADGR